MRLRGGLVCALVLQLACLGLAQDKPVDPWRELMDRGNRLAHAGDYTGAAVIYRQAVHDVETSNDRRLAIALNALGNVDDQLGRTSESEPLFRRALAIMEGTRESDPVYGLTLSNLGVHYLELGQREKAAELLEASMLLLPGLVAADSIELALARNALANLWMAEGRFDKAEVLIEKSLDTFRKHRQPGSEQLAIGLNNLGVVRMRQGRSEEGMQLFQESIAIVETENGPDHPTLLRALVNLASVYGKEGRRAQAHATFERAMAIAEKRLGTGHPLYGIILLGYAKYLRGEGEKAAARTLETRAQGVLHDNAVSNGRGMTVDVSAFRQ